MEERGCIERPFIQIAKPSAEGSLPQSSRGGIPQLQQGLCALQTERVGGVGGIGFGKGEAVVGRHTGGVDVVKAILVGIDGKGETVRRGEDVAAETERAVGKA